MDGIVERPSWSSLWVFDMVSVMSLLGSHILFSLQAYLESHNFLHLNHVRSAVQSNHGCGRINLLTTIDLDSVHMLPNHSQDNLKSQLFRPDEKMKLEVRIRKNIQPRILKPPPNTLKENDTLNPNITV